MQLTQDQKAALESGQPIVLMIDQTECIVVRRDAYDVVRENDALNHDELRSVLARSFESSDWSSPEMDVYDAI